VLVTIFWWNCPHIEKLVGFGYSNNNSNKNKTIQNEQGLLIFKPTVFIGFIGMYTILNKNAQLTKFLFTGGLTSSNCYNGSHIGFEAKNKR
jgi:hypothetical protein